MKDIQRRNISRNKLLGRVIIIVFSLLFLYLVISIYFNSHFFFHTVINEVDVSLKAYKDLDKIMKEHEDNYVLQLVERDGRIETIRADEIGLHYNPDNQIPRIFKLQKSLGWIKALAGKERYHVKNLYSYDTDKLDRVFKGLNCLNTHVTPPRDVKFQYREGSYQVIAEEYGNQVKEDKLRKAVHTALSDGVSVLDLVKADCYEKPRFTLSSEKTAKTLALLNKYVSAKITYQFDNKIELIDGNVINRWLRIDNDLNVVINRTALENFIDELAYKYDTVGKTREFKSSVGKVIEVTGGLYGWKIDKAAELKELTINLNRGEVITREPVYAQKALPRDNELGDSYVEINLTRQYLWYYKKGKLITHGAVVTGNPNRGNGTVVGVYMLNYKQKDADLIGENYQVKVTYWMPFYGNIGLHDARWRHAFGGEIYKTRGTHGCVNAPYSLAKTVYENIEEGTPFICYEEKE